MEKGIQTPMARGRCDTVKLPNLLLPQKSGTINIVRPGRYSTEGPLNIIIGWSTLWRMTLSSKVNLPRTMNLKALCDANLVTLHPRIRPLRTPRNPPCGETVLSISIYECIYICLFTRKGAVSADVGSIHTNRPHSGGGRPLLKEGGPISYEPRPS